MFFAEKLRNAIYTVHRPMMPRGMGGFPTRHRPNRDYCGRKSSACTRIPKDYLLRWDMTLWFIPLKHGWHHEY